MAAAVSCTVCVQIVKRRESVTPASSLLVSALSIRNKNIFPQNLGHVITPQCKGGWESKYLPCPHLCNGRSKGERGENAFCCLEHRSPLMNSELIVLPGKKSSSFPLREFGSLDGPQRIEAKFLFFFYPEGKPRKNYLNK